MDEVRATPKNGLRVVSTFSGCGGSCLGMRMAGLDVVWASEFVPAAAEVYRLNHETKLDERDIREVTAEEILETIGLSPGEVDLLEGSPPCAAFSKAGSREKNWGKVKGYSDRRQRVDDLALEFVRLIRGIRPRAFMMENVPGLAHGKAKGYFRTLLAEMRGCGYRVSARVLRADWLGVPQDRRRLFIVGFRDDLGIEPVFPRPLKHTYTLRDAVSDVDSLSYWNPKSFSSLPATRSSVLPSPTITTHGIANAVYYYVGVERTSEIAREQACLAQGQQSTKYFQLTRPRAGEPCPTITATGGQSGAAGVMHPVESREFTIQELKSICSFPADFRLTGSYRKQWERLGRSVPPLMMREIASTIARALLSLDAGSGRGRE